MKYLIDSTCPSELDSLNRYLFHLYSQQNKLDICEVLEFSERSEQAYCGRKNLKKQTGIFPEIWSAKSIAKVCGELGIKDYDRTAKTQAPSFTKNWLSNHSNRTLKNIASARTVDKLRSTFIETIKNYVVNGKIHADINQLKGEKACSCCANEKNTKCILLKTPSEKVDIAVNLMELKQLKDLIRGTLFQLSLNQLITDICRN